MKILFISYTNIGDVVMSTALLNRVLADYPDAKVDVIVGGLGAELFANLPQLGRILTIKKRKHHRHYLDLRRELAHEHYDILIDLRTPFFKFFVNHDRSITFPKRLQAKYAAKVEQLGSLWPSARKLEQKVWIEPRVMEVVQEKATKIKRPLVVVGPTANWAGKQWPQKNFKELIEKLSQHDAYKNATFLLLGAPNERKDIEDLIATVPAAQSLDLVGKTTISESYAWLKMADVFVGHDSGLSHLAAAAGTPSITLFGPMNDKIYAPWSDVNHVVVPPMRTWREVNLPKKKYLPRVISDITVKTVLNCFIRQEIQPNNKKTEKRHVAG